MGPKNRTAVDPWKKKLEHTVIVAGEGGQNLCHVLTGGCIEQRI